MRIIELKDIEQEMEPILESFCRNKIYTNGNIIYKIYEPDGCNDFNDFLKSTEQFIDYLYSIRNIDGCVIPSGKIYNDDKFIGIFMSYYEYYINFECLIANNIKFEVKLKLVKDLICALENLHSKNIVHNDLHLGNVITNLTDTKIIDLDEGTLISNNRENYKSHDIKDLLVVILSVLYNVDIMEYLKDNLIEEFLSFINLSTDFKEYIQSQYYCMDTDKLIYPNIFLDNIDYEQIEYDKKKLSKYKIH